MNSAALRSRTTKHGGEDGDDTAGPAPVLDTDAQEALVLELEKDARRQATIWRRVFGALSIAWGVYFIDCAARAASGDITRAWSGAIHAEFYHHDPPTMSTDVLAMLDLLTALAGVGAGVAAIYPAKTTRSRLAMGDDDCMPSLPGWTRRVRTLAFVMSTAFGACACVGWAWTMRRTYALHRGDAKEGGRGGRDDFDFYRMSWLPFASLLAPGVCWHVYQSLERGTVVEAAKLRGYMYDHKRA